MAKPIFLAGGITAEDHSWMIQMAIGLANHPNRAELWPEAAPDGLLDRLNASPGYQPAAAELIVAQKQARIEELEAGPPGQSGTRVP